MASDELVLVPTQEDRDAAADYGRATGAVSPGEAAAIKAGQWDALPRVQWFARRRKAAAPAASLAREGEVERETIARIIDPAAWQQRERFQEIIRGEGRLPRSEAALATLKRSAENRVDRIVEPSLAKADAILAALSRPQGVEGEL